MLKAYISELKNLVRWASQLLQIDVAVFGQDCEVLACSDCYRKMKGSAVHALSIQEVIDEGKLMVHRPGHMKSCFGCRFRGNCPAKIEILRAIVVGGESIGVITFTSFTEEGHAKITSALSMYKNAQKSIIDWLVSVIRAREQSEALGVMRQLLQGTVELSETPLFVVDREGLVTWCNKPATRLFSSCNLYSCSLSHLLPSPVVDEILAGRRIRKMKLQTDQYRFSISSLSSVQNGEFQGAVIYLSSPGSEEKPALDIAAVSQLSLDDFKGQSGSILSIKKDCRKIADSPSTILIQGETGTGKSMLAKIIHSLSKRSRKPFIVVNCSSIPESLFESELFGYEEGAFTGAKKGGKPGKFEQADGGTLFFDEIAEMPLSMQVKLLSVLQENVVERVGGTMQIPVDIRYIAATNRDLSDLIHRKKFRSDLFYRLNIIPFYIPPLRERMTDIFDLVPEFSQKCSRKLKRNLPQISEEFIHLLRKHSWPGNARELQNIIEYCINMEDSGILSTNSLPQHFWTSCHTAENLSMPQRTVEETAKKEDAEEGANILKTVAAYGWDMKGKKAAAKALGISLRTLYRRLEKMDTTESRASL